MKRSRVVVLAGMFCCALASCSVTNVAQLDDTFGYERFVGGRIARVLVPRGQMVEIDAPEPDDVVIVAPVGPHSPVRYHRFLLRLKLHNESDVPWALDRSQIELAFTDSETMQCTECGTPPPGPLAEVAAHAVGDVAIPVVIGLGENVSMRQAEKYWIEITIHGGPAGDALLHRRLAIGSYDQTWQLVRFGLVLTALLVIAGA